jgi:hypothetical protein
MDGKKNAEWDFLFPFWCLEKRSAGLISGLGKNGNNGTYGTDLGWRRERAEDQLRASRGIPNEEF